MKYWFVKLNNGVVLLIYPSLHYVMAATFL